MVLQKEVCVIIMLSPLIENNTKTKCLQYWPDSGTKEYGCVEVKIQGVVKWPDYEMRNLLVSDVEERMSATVTHMFYLSWPHHGVPANVASLLNLRYKSSQLIRQRMKDLGGHKPTTAVVHSSAGVGRTGTMIAVDWLIEEGKRTDFVDPLACLRGLRKQRNKMVETESQYLYCYRVLAAYVRLGETTVYRGDELRKFLGQEQSVIRTALERQIELIQETCQPNNTFEKENASKKFLSSEYYSSFSRRQAFRLQSIEEVTSQSSLYDVIIDSCFVVVMGDKAMESLKQWIPAEGQQSSGRRHCVVRKKGPAEIELLIQESTKVSRNDHHYENSALEAKELVVQCVGAGRELKDCYGSFSGKLRDRKELPLLIVYSGDERQECLWSLVRVCVLEMKEVCGEVDVFQAVYHFINSQSSPLIPPSPHYNHTIPPSSTPNSNLHLNVESYREVYDFALDLVQNENMDIYDELEDSYLSLGQVVRRKCKYTSLHPPVH